MNWLVAPNAFKGTIDADKAASIIKETIQAIHTDAKVVACPIADGGDGTCFLLSGLLGLEKEFAMVTDPLGRSVQGFFSFDSVAQTAFLDVSTVSGIKWLREEEKDPWTCSSYGTGELILKAIEKGARNIVLGLGGSATVDMGTGILRALGVLFLDKNGREIPVHSSHFLEKTAHIQLTKKIPDVKFTFLCDVGNTYFGAEGAVPVFGPQKGLKASDQRKFELVSEKIFELLKAKSKWGLTDQKCFGAAGGIALGLSAFFQTEMAAGAQYYFEMVKIHEKIKVADVVVTGEGRYDQQSAQGKGSYELLIKAKENGKKVWLITSGEDGKQSGFDAVIRLPDLDLNDSQIQEKAELNLAKAVKDFLIRP